MLLTSHKKSHRFIQRSVETENKDNYFKIYFFFSVFVWVVCVHGCVQVLVRGD